MKIRHFILAAAILVSGLVSSYRVYANTAPACPAGSDRPCLQTADGTIYYCCYVGV